MEEKKKGGYITITKKDLLWVAGFVIVAILAFAGILIARHVNYRKAVQLFEDGQYDKAYEAFLKLNDYRDCPEKLIEVKHAMLINAKPGDRIYFGNYYTGDKKDDKKEYDIAWVVLEVNDGKALLISEQNIDYFRWQVDNYNYELKSWEDSALRSYLNYNFLNGAFSEEEKAKILDTVVVPDKDTHEDRFADALDLHDRVKENETVDKVFVLSVSEAMNYFSTDESRKSDPTIYTTRTNKYMEPTLFHTADLVYDETHSWWLRTRIDTRANEHYVCYVEESGRIVRGDCYNNHAIRPVIRVSME